MSSLSLLRAEAIQYVRQHPFLPEYVKEFAEASVRRHFQSMSQEIGALELACRRTEQHILEKSPPDA